jgi:hypothetical protein
LVDGEAAEGEVAVEREEDDDVGTTTMEGVDESGELPAGEDSDRVKNLQSSSCVASDGTFPTHITHSER